MSNSGKVQGVDKLVMNGLFIGLLIWVSFVFTDTSGDPGFSIRHLGLSFFSFGYSGYFLAYRNYPFPMLNKIQWGGFSAYLIFILIGICSAVFGVNPSEGISPFLININFLILILIVTHAISIGLRFSSISFVVSLIGSFSAIFGLLQFFKMLPLELMAGSPPTALQFNRNFFASSQVLAFPFVLISIISSTGIKRQVSISSAVLVLLSISISQTRSAILSMIIFGFIVLLAIVFRYWRRGVLGQKKGVVSLILIVFLILSGSFGTYYGRKVGSDFKKFFNTSQLNNRQSSIEERLAIWKGSMDDVFMRHPILGVGFGNWKIHYSGSYTQPTRAQGGRVVISKAHNVYLEVLCETGVIGFLFYLLFVFVAIRIILKRWFENDIVIIIGAGYAAYLSDQVFSFGNYQPTHIAYIGILLGYLYYVELPEPKGRIKKQTSSIFGTIVSLISLFAIYWFFTFLLFEKSYEKGLKTRKNGDFLESKYHFERAVHNVHSLNRDGRSPHLEKAIVYNEEGEYDLAITELQKAWVDNPFNARVQDTYGRSYFGKKDFVKAELHFQKAYNILSRSNDIIESLAICYFKNGKFEKCIELLNESGVNLNEQLRLIFEVSNRKVQSI